MSGREPELENSLHIRADPAFSFRTWQLAGKCRRSSLGLIQSFNQTAQCLGMQRNHIGVLKVLVFQLSGKDTA